MTASPTPFSQSAADISSPKSVRVGLAASTNIRREAAPITHPGLVSLPGSASTLESLAVASLDAFLPVCGRATSGRVILPRRARTFIEPQPRDQIADNAANRSPVMPVSHAPEHAAPAAQGVAKSLQAQAREMIWALAPRDWTGKRKAAIAKVARLLGWEYSRTWNVAHNRARRIDASEMDRLRAEISKLETQSKTNSGALDGLDDLIRRAAGAGGAAGGTGEALSADRERGDGACEAGVRPVGPAGAGVRR